MIIKTKKFSYKGENYEIRARAQADEVVVQAFDSKGQKFGRSFAVRYETASDFKSATGDSAIESLIQVAQDDIEQERLPELQKALAGVVSSDHGMGFNVIYYNVGNEEQQLPDTFGHLDEAVKAACDLLVAGKAKFVDIPDPKQKGGGGGLRHSQIVERGKQLGYFK